MHSQAHLIFIQLSQLTSSPLYVSPFFSSTSCAPHGIKSCVNIKRRRWDGRGEAENGRVRAAYHRMPRGSAQE